MENGCEFDMCYECDLVCCSLHPLNNVEEEEREQEEMDFQYELSKISEERMEYCL